MQAHTSASPAGKRGAHEATADRHVTDVVTEPKLPALLMQCAVRPCTTARSRSARAQAASPPRLSSSRGLAAAARGARCSRKRAGGVVAATPRRLVTTCGLPIVGGIPVIGPLLSSPLVTLAWAVGGFKLFTGFSRTTYTDALLPKLALCALWPVLFAVSATFREQFKRAL